MANLKVKDAQVNTPVIQCIDIDGLVDFILRERQCRSEHVEMKVGVDGGGGFLKICLNIVDLLEECGENPPKRAKYCDGIAKKTLRWTGVKKLIILSLAPDVAETHENIYVGCPISNLFRYQEIVLGH